MAGLSLGFYVYGLVYTFNFILILGNYFIMRFIDSRVLAMKLMVSYSATLLLVS